MTIMTVTVRDGDRYYSADLTWRQAQRHNNHAMVSCGLTVGQDLRRSTLIRWLNAGTAREITKDKWNHSGCQSSCTQRGGSECRW